MRILHTSDWHLGATLHGHSRLKEQELFLEFLLKESMEKKVDALLVAGDIYDVSQPSIEAQKIFSEFLVRFHQNCPQSQILVIGGNHDSGPRLEISRPLTEALGGLHLIGKVSEQDADLEEKCLIPLKKGEGEIAGVCIALPFLRVGDLKCTFEEGKSVADIYSSALQDLYLKLIKSARKKHPGLPLIGMGHLTLAKSEMSGSEMHLIGGIESIPSALFAQELDYFALGHIHRPQKIGAEHLRYCGSPYPISFDESSYPQQVLMVEWTPERKITPLFVPRSVDFFSIPPTPGNWEALEESFHSQDWNLYAELPEELHPFVQFQLTKEEALGNLRERFNELTHGKALRLAGPPKIQQTSQKRNTQEISDKQTKWELNDQGTPERLLKKTWQERYGEELPKHLAVLFQEALQESRKEATP